MKMTDSSINVPALIYSAPDLGSPWRNALADGRPSKIAMMGEESTTAPPIWARVVI
jgi:hypothetical protein